jgi:hypothetical protein
MIIFILVNLKNIGVIVDIVEENLSHCQSLIHIG